MCYHHPLFVPHFPMQEVIIAFPVPSLVSATEVQAPNVPIGLSERLQSLLSPKELLSDDFDAVQEFIERGGRLRAIDYTKIPREEKQAGFRRAREYLSQPMHSVVAGVAVQNPDHTYHHPNPNDPLEIFAPIHPLPRGYVDEVMDIARDSQWCPHWDGQKNFTARQKVIDKFIASVYQDRATLAALMALCQGKTGHEVYRDMQELFDFWREYREVQEVMKYNESLLRSNGDTTLEYRPIDGVVGIWQPFNFSCIGAGDTMAALLMGNAVVIHTSARNVGTYKWLYDKLLEAGVPPERVQFVIPHDDSDPAKIDVSMSEALAAHPDMQLIQFTGSHKVAKDLHKIQAQKVQDPGGIGRLDYKLQAEASGYNPFLITGLPEGAMRPLHAFLVMGGHEDDEPTKEAWDQFFAELDRDGGTLKNFLRAVVDSVTGLQAHKCSSCKEFIVAVDDREFDGIHSRDVAMLKLLVTERLKRVKIGPAEGGGVEMGALIDRRMHAGIRAQLQKIVEEGGQLLTANSPEDIDGIMTVEGQPQAMKVAFYDVPDGNLDTMDKVEIFAPVVRWNEVEGIEAAIVRANDLGYALTATVVASTAAEADAVRRELPHGVPYASGDKKVFVDGGEEEASIDGCTGAPAPQLPFGGSGKSGTGSAYRPGNTRSPFAFTKEVSVSRFPRAEWGKGKHPSPTSDVLDSVFRRDPEGVIAWVRENVKVVGEGGLEPPTAGL